MLSTTKAQLLTIRGKKRQIYEQAYEEANLQRQQQTAFKGEQKPLCMARKSIDKPTAHNMTSRQILVTQTVKNVTP